MLFEMDWWPVKGRFDELGRANVEAALSSWLWRSSSTFHGGGPNAGVIGEFGLENLSGSLCTRYL
jgi:hypothetical protein